LKSLILITNQRIILALTASHVCVNALALRVTVWLYHWRRFPGSVRKSDNTSRRILWVCWHVPWFPPACFSCSGLWSPTPTQRSGEQTMASVALNACTHQRASSYVLWKQTSVHVVLCRQSTLGTQELSSPPRTYTLRGRLVRTSLTRAHERDWIALTHFPPPWGHTPRTAYAFSSDRVWTNVKPRWRSGRHSTCPQATTTVVSGSMLVTVLGECAVIRGTLPLT
jgi:hypothetical protein